MQETVQVCREVTRNVDLVIHAAALKHVGLSEWGQSKKQKLCKQMFKALKTFFKLQKVFQIFIY